MRGLSCSPSSSEPVLLSTVRSDRETTAIASPRLTIQSPYTVTQKDLYPGTQLDQDPKKKTIVVLGNGWGATSFLKQLDNEEYNVVVISPRNYFLFSPLLPSVTVGTLEARSIIQPTRFITRHKKRKVAVYEAEATDVDPIGKTVTIEGESLGRARADQPAG